MSAIAVQSVRPSVTTELVTPEELLNMDDKGLFELVDGKLVEKRMGPVANVIVGKITHALITHLQATNSGDVVVPEQTFQCFPQRPSLVRRPDIAVILASRLPSVLPTGHVDILPDLAIEVVSPNDNVYELDDKLADYRAAGIPMTWVVNPDARLIRVYRPRQFEELYDGDVLRGDPVLPGFVVNVTDLLPPRRSKIESPVTARL